MKIKLLNRETKEVVKMTLPEVLEEINRDRSDEWQKYDESDWQEGLEEFTEYTLVLRNEAEKQLSDEDFDKKYQLEDIESENFEVKGQFETFGKDLEIVLKYANEQPRKVWTVIDGEDDNLWIVSGYHLVNRVFYYITKEECKEVFEDYIIEMGD